MHLEFEIKKTQIKSLSQQNSENVFRNLLLWRVVKTGFAVDWSVGVMSAGIQWFWTHGQLTPALFSIPRLFCTQLFRT